MLTFAYSQRKRVIALGISPTTCSLPPSWITVSVRRVNTNCVTGGDFKEAHLRTLSLPKTAMVVTTDIGDADSIHPRNKQEVGRRLGLAARAIAYGQNVVYFGPLYSSMEVEEGKVRLQFAHCEDGLAASGNRAYVQGFEIAGPDRRFYAADGALEGNTVILHSDSVSQPVAVRYSWRNYPNGNLFNESGLPASPFRTDDWDDATPAH